MRRIITTLLLLLPLFFLQGQENLELLSHIDYTGDLHGNGNDIWGYVAPNGDEYAIVGATKGTLIYSLKDPKNPKEELFIPGSNSIWRDMKHWKEYVYVTTDSGTDGLLIINMSNPDSISYVFRNHIIPGTETVLNKCHNIYIDENGFIYLSGCHGRGVEILDPNIDPWDPPFVGAIPGPYHHDAYVNDNILFGSRILKGDLGLYDVTDKANPKEISSTPTSSNFTHNAWGSPDNKYIFTTDERSNAYVDAYDVSDPTNIEFLDKIIPFEKEGTGTILHNVHYHEGYLVVSWYTAGVVVIDANKPDNLVEVGHYDTYPGADGGFKGCWGVTPFLPSGIVLANDINTGLYIFQPNYVRACYLEGKITDKYNGISIPNVEITIDLERTAKGYSHANGSYKMGTNKAADTVVVKYTHPDYFPGEATVSLKHGEVTIQDMKLTKLPSHNIDFLVVNEETNEVLKNAEIEFERNGNYRKLTTDENGNAYISVLQGEHNFYFGKWGYSNVGLVNQNITENTTYTIKLAPGYMDDFAVDLGWKVKDYQIGTKPFIGTWERAIPIGTFRKGYPLNPDHDVMGDIGKKAYVTMNSDDPVFWNSFVANGRTELYSPKMDLLDYTNPSIEFKLWFAGFENVNGPYDDAIEVFLHNQQDSILLIRYDDVIHEWTERLSFPVEGINITDSMYLKVVISDLPEKAHPIEGGFDNFRVLGVNTRTSDVTKDQLLKIFPTPASAQMTIQAEQLIKEVHIYNTSGNLVFEQRYSSTNETTVKTADFTNGAYIVQTKLNNGHVVVQKIVVQH